jgi:hypothetical protein
MSFWPIAIWIRSPGFHALSHAVRPTRLRQAGVGSRPLASPPMSSPVAWPKPNFRAHACIFVQYGRSRSPRSK